MGWPIGLALGFAAAVTGSIGFLFRERGAVASPDVDARRPVRSVRDLFSAKWWTIGFVLAFFAWAMQVAALKIAPLSLVQGALASGFVVLGFAAERWFGFNVGRREWLGIVLTTAGLALLAVTASASNTGGNHARYALGAAIAFAAALVLCGTLLLLGHRVDRMNGYRGPLLAAASGLIFTVSHIGIKALIHNVSLSRPSSVLNAWIPIVVAAFVVAFFTSARSLQLGPAVPVIAITTAVGNASAIAAGVVVFGDPLGSNSILVALRIASFALVVIAAALLPAPTRTAGAMKERGARETSSREGAGARLEPTPSTG